jgi:hypothetical protein
MSLQAYLDNVEEKTGLTPRQIVDQAHAKGFDPRRRPARSWPGSRRSTGSVAGTGWRKST